ncbi:MAG: hypothetical protein VYD18_16905, partial [Candidatus Latescibacterota bacterium]|nr:hypothetical protein [Candidatus Latescibacterota bacterium]
MLAAPVVAASPFGGAFLDTGLGARAAGMGGAVSAAVEGPAAMLYNPAGLAARRGRSLLVSYQPLSLDRSRASLAGSMNVRGPLAFGLAWLHAGVDGLVARNGSGEVLEGGIDDAEDAVFFALGINATPRLQLGLGVKIIDHRIEAPQAGESSANGRAVDLGLRYRLGDNTVIGIAARNLLDKLSWSVIRPSAQTSSSDEALMSVLALGVAHDWRGVVNAAFDVEWLDVGGERNLRAHGGIEAPLNDLLTIRGGVQRMGDADGFGLPAFGVTMR